MKLAVRRGHCDAAQRDYDAIERTHNLSWLIARDDVTVAAKRERLSSRGPLRGLVGTVSEPIDLVGQYQDAGVQLLIDSDYRNDTETLELLVSETCRISPEGRRFPRGKLAGHKRWRYSRPPHPGRRS